jgi:tetrahydromethanopterin S-methyltransferase subunit G
MKTNKEKFVEIDGRIKLVNQKIDLIIKNHLAHMKKDIDRILYGLGAVGLLVLGQLLYILTK